MSIKIASQNIESPEFNEARVHKNLKETISSKKNRSIQLYRRKTLAVAATLLILSLSFWLLTPKGFDLSVPAGDQLAHSLPDESSIIINGSSSISYNPKNYNQTRVVELQGEAFFDVKKAGSFVVETELGNIEVLGTSFNVFQRADILIVSCKTGKVGVKTKNTETILTPGKEVLIQTGKQPTVQNVNIDDISSWKSGESKFQRAPLSAVILSLENQFGVDIEINDDKLNETFTGSYLHQNLNLALRMVFEPMGLNFEIKEKNIVVVN